MNYIKNFKDWFEKKATLDARMAIYSFKAGEVWWCSMGINIGSEIDGKNSALQSDKQFFARPVIIIKKVSRTSCIVIPTTSQSKVGSWFFPISFDSRHSHAVLPQIRMIDSRRLQRRIVQLSDTKLQQIIRAMTQFLMQK